MRFLNVRFVVTSFGMIKILSLITRGVGAHFVWILTTTSTPPNGKKVGGQIEVR